MTYASIALALLKIALWFIDQAKARSQFDAGADAEAAKVTQAILRKTQVGKVIMGRLDAMDPQRRNDFTDELGS